MLKGVLIGDVNRGVNGYTYERIPGCRWIYII